MTVYATCILCWLIAIVLYIKKQIVLKPLVMVVLYLFGIAFGFTYEMTLGLWLKLYHYYNPEQSVYWMLLMGVFVYPVIHVVYVNWLLTKKSAASWLLYTAAWIVVMMISEILSVLFHIVVFTGWHMWPWSPLTYLIVFSCDTLLYYWMSKHMQTTRSPA